MQIKYSFEEQRRDTLMRSVDEIRYTQPTLSVRRSYRFRPASLFIPRVMPHHPFYHQVHAPFSFEQFQYPRPPIDLGHSRLSFDSLSGLVNVLRLPIKYPRTEFRLPLELKPLYPLIERIAHYEASFNDEHDKNFVHVTSDLGLVQEGTTHRYPGFHTDGLQGSKFSQNQHEPIEHSYIVTSAPPTEFCIQPFFFRHLDDAKHNVFHEMEVQARETNTYYTLPWHLYLIDPYMVHRTPQILESIRRVFLRVTFASSELMNPHNTVSPFFGTPQYRDRHDIRSFLTLCPSDVPWPMYGFSGGPTSRL